MIVLHFVQVQHHTGNLLIHTVLAINIKPFRQLKQQKEPVQLIKTAKVFMTGDVIVKLTIYTFAQILQTMAAAEEATAAFMRRSEVI